MSVKRIIVLTCDKCGTSEYGGDSVRAARAAVAVHGWRMGWKQNRTRMDICSNCAQTGETL